MQMVALSPLMQRRGLKHQHGWRLLGGVESPLMQRRGLKLQYALKVRTAPLSPLMQRRGLKLDESAQLLALFGRLSCRGVD